MLRSSRIAGLAAAMAVAVGMAPWITYGQHLNSARGIALGGFTGVGEGVSSLDWNPAALVSVREWEFDVSNFMPLSVQASGFVLQSVAIGKRFLEHHAAALRYSPGRITEFVLPTSFTFSDSVSVVRTTFDQKVSYQEPYVLGYAHRWKSDISFGVAGRFIQEKITDTKYFVDSNSTIRSSTVDYEGAFWTVDIGLRWSVEPEWRYSAVVKNLFKISGERLAEEVAQYRLDLPTFLQLGMGYSGVKNFLFGLDADTEKRFRLGVEWSVPTGIDEHLSVRAGMYAKPAVEAVSVGLGGGSEFADFDVSYLKFLSQTNRKGTADFTTFSSSAIKDVEYNPFTGDRLSLTVTVHFGGVREPAAHIELVELLSDVYPASSMVHAYHPLGRAIVRNISEKPITARIHFFVERLMDVPTESKPVSLAPGERTEVPFYALFNDNVKSVAGRTILEGNVSVSSELTERADDRVPTRLVVHGRNDWNGDITMLRYFVTPNDPEILKFTRAALNSHKDRIDTSTLMLRDFLRARILFDEFSQRLTYVHDPKQSQDFVQYPSETLALHGGDCDDMTVCYSTLLMSIGVSVAFIDVIPPERPSEAHIYLMFDTGIEAQYAQLLGDNPKRYILRKNTKGVETVWVPVETTVITKGFEEAWKVGAKEYYDDVELGLGLPKGWVRIVDLLSVF